MIEHDPIAADARRERREHDLAPEAVCCSCGEENRELLRTVRDRQVKTSLLQHHHVAGHANDPDLTIALCRNCHALHTEGQLTVGIALHRDRERAPIERLVNVLRGLAVFFRLLAQALESWARTLAAHVRQLDARIPDWRTWERET